MFKAFIHASTCAEKASLISTRSMSLIDLPNEKVNLEKEVINQFRVPVFSRSFSMAGTGP